MRTFDIIVVGSGPAGAAAALVAARAGLRVALLDRHAFPRDKLCGGGFTGRALGIWQDLMPGTTPPGMTTVDRFEFHAAGRLLARIEDAPPMHLTTRIALDCALHDAAVAAGAEPLTGTVEEVSLTPPTVRLAGVGTIGGTVMIGADGVKSAVARAVFGQSFDPGTIGFGLEIEADPLPPGSPIRIDFGAARWGYGWQFPKPGSTTTGVGGVLARNADMRGALAAYMRVLDLTEGPKVKGHHLPFGAFRAVPGRGTVLLAGDAAGLVDPITGEGIAYAMESGAMAARAAAEAIRSGDPQAALSQYRRALAPIHDDLRRARRLRQIIFRRPLGALFESAFATSGHLRHEYLRLMAGQTTYAALSRTALRRMPGFLWRGLRRLPARGKSQQ